MYAQGYWFGRCVLIEVLELGFSLPSVIMCHGKRFGRRILPVFPLTFNVFVWLLYLRMRSITCLSIKNGSWCGIVPGVAAVRARARARRIVL